MDKRLFLIPALCALLTGCSQDSSMGTTNQDNSMMMNQNQMDTDNAITQKINNWLSSDASLSMSAKSIEVTTSNGMVTLDGSVANAQEKDKIMKKVKKMNGVKGVKDRLTMMNG